MSEVEKEVTEFPGESEAEVTAGCEAKAETAEAGAEPTSEPETKAGPWFVAEILDKALTEDGLIMAKQIADAGAFKLQIEADAWIKDNAKESTIYASLRRGKLMRAKVVRKMEEL